MALKDQLIAIASVKDTPCVTISLNTHRTHPDNQQDEILLKNLLKEAENRLLEKYTKREVASLLEKVENVHSEIDFNHNLDSLHIFLADDFKEIVKSPWPTTDVVEVNHEFSLRPLIKAYSRIEDYLILKITLDDIHLYEALNDGIVEEIRNDFFPFSDGKYEVHNADKGGDPNQVLDRVKELFNRIDKAALQVYNETGLDIVVITSDQNYSLLINEADRPSIYVAHSSIDNNSIKPHQLAEQAWEVVKGLQHSRRTAAIEEVKAGTSNSLVVTDLQEMYWAAIDGRGELLIVKNDFEQAVRFSDDRNFDLAEDPKAPGVIDDITTNIAKEILTKKGRVVFTDQDELGELGDIALLVRY